MARPRIAPENLHNVEFHTRYTQKSGTRIRHCANDMHIKPAELLRMCYEAVEKNDTNLITFLHNRLMEDDCY